MVDREQIHQAIDRLSPQNLEIVGELIKRLNLDEGGSDWAKDFYELFAPVHQQVRELEMTEDEVNQFIDEAIEEVRNERKA